MSTTETGECQEGAPGLLTQPCSLSYFLRPDNKPAISFGALDFTAPPRPERLGLVMKYCCALNGSLALAHFHAPGRTVGQYLVALLVVNQIAQHDL